YAPRRRRPMKAIPTNCDAKEDRWCCAGFVSTAGSLTVEYRFPKSAVQLRNHSKRACGRVGGRQSGVSSELWFPKLPLVGVARPSRIIMSCVLQADSQWERRTP